MVGSLVGVVFPLASIAIFLMGFIWQYDIKDSYQKGFKNTVCASLGVLTLITGLLSLTSEVTVIHWLIGLIVFNPITQISTAVPLLVHILSLCSLLIILPLTRYIKLFNMYNPMEYLLGKLLNKSKKLQGFALRYHIGVNIMRTPLKRMK